MKVPYSLVYVLLPGTLSLIGLLGMIIHGTYTDLPGLGDHAGIHSVALWLSSLTLFYAFQAVPLVLSLFEPLPKVILWTSIIYHYLSAILVLLIFVAYSIARRPDGAVWAALLLLACCYNFFLAWLRKKLTSSDIFMEEKKRRALPYKKTTEVILLTINRALKLLFLIILGFLVKGAFLLGVGALRYPPRGNLIPVTLSSGVAMKFHVLCDGPQNSSLPVIWIEPGENHFIPDLFGIQDELLRANRRFCIHDPPGQGSTSNLPSDGNYAYYEELLAALTDRPPFIMVGWGGGGSKIYSYAQSHPDTVLGLALLDSYPNNFEWDALQREEGLSDEELAEHRRRELRSRQVKTNQLRGLGAPLGLTTMLFPPSSSYVPQELEEERRYLVVTDKTWNSQYFALKEILKADREDDPFEEPLEPSIRILTIVSVPSGFGNGTDLCLDAGIEVPSEECDEKIQSEQFAYESRTNVTLTSTQGSVVHCVGCSMEFPYQKPSFVVSSILDALGDLTIPQSDSLNL